MNRREAKNGLILGASAAIALIIIFLAFQLTRAPIEKTAKIQLQNNLIELLAAGSYDNDPATDLIKLSDAVFGTTEPQPIYRARAAGKPTGIVITAQTQEGYNGTIKLLIGLSYDGHVVAVRVTNHKETPGLGDDIDIARSNWITSFNGASPTTMPPRDWQVKKDGGQFDQFTGATITPRAVIQLVHRVTQWYQQNQKNVFINKLDTGL